MAAAALKSKGVDGRVKHGHDEVSADRAKPLGRPSAHYGPLGQPEANIQTGFFLSRLPLAFMMHHFVNSAYPKPHRENHHWNARRHRQLRVYAQTDGAQSTRRIPD